ncbi:MAG: sulfite exporter TauE/SafE family protein [Pseudomonadota bacterium]
MDAALIGSAALLGLAGAPHCTAMCGAACAAASGRARGSGLAFQAARVGGYALGGAVAAASVGSLLALAQLAPALRPLWPLVHVAALALGVFLMWTGRQPAWLAAVGRRPQPAAAPAGWQRVQGPARAALAGGLWIAWPCGLLQSALLVASLTQGAAGGAAAMAAFAATSSLGLLWAPWVWARVGRDGAVTAERWTVRAAGAMLLAGSGFALGHGLWSSIAAFCGIG